MALFLQECNTAMVACRHKLERTGQCFHSPSIFHIFSQHHHLWGRSCPSYIRNRISSMAPSVIHPEQGYRFPGEHVWQNPNSSLFWRSKPTPKTCFSCLFEIINLMTSKAISRYRYCNHEIKSWRGAGQLSACGEICKKILTIIWSWVYHYDFHQKTCISMGIVLATPFADPRLL